MINKITNMSIVTEMKIKVYNKHNGLISVSCVVKQMLLSFKPFDVHFDNAA